jgi:hypothetical protein
MGIFPKSFFDSTRGEWLSFTEKGLPEKMIPRMLADSCLTIPAKSLSAAW